MLQRGRSWRTNIAMALDHVHRDAGTRKVSGAHELRWNRRDAVQAASDRISQNTSEGQMTWKHVPPPSTTPPSADIHSLHGAAILCCTSTLWESMAVQAVPLQSSCTAQRVGDGALGVRSRGCEVYIQLARLQTSPPCVLVQTIIATKLYCSVRTGQPHIECPLIRCGQNFKRRCCFKPSFNLNTLKSTQGVVFAWSSWSGYVRRTGIATKMAWKALNSNWGWRN